MRNHYIMVHTNDHQHSQRTNGMEYYVPAHSHNRNSFGNLLRRAVFGLMLLLGLTGFSLPAFATITVKMTSPTANASVAAPGTFTLTATATSTAGTIKSVAFYQGTTLLSTVTTSPYTYSWTAVAAGTYSLTAKATGSTNATATSTAVSVKSVTDTGPVVSLTSPAVNTKVAAPASFTLTATATSSVSTISSVAFYQGTTLLGTVTKSPYTYSWTGVAAGTYSITAKATDALGKATTSTAVSVSSLTPPTVSLTSPAANASVAAPASFTLTSNASSTSSTIKSVAFSNGTTLLNTVTAAPYTYTWSAVAAGTYSLTAKATDANNLTTTSTAVSVKSVTDTGPVVSITSPANNKTIAAPASFTLTATATSTVSTISSVAFYQGTTLLGTVTASPYTYTWSAVTAGTYSITAKATDALGKTTTSTAVSVVSDAPPVVTITNPLPGSQITSPSGLKLTATATSATSTISKVDFYQGATLIGTSPTSPYSMVWSAVPVGSYSLTAKATDALGTVTTSAAIPVTAVADQLPVVTILTPGNGTTVTAPAAITLSANATSSTSTIASVSYYNGATLIGTATVAPFTYNWTNVALGTYTITAQAKDVLNTIANSSSVTLVVNNGAPQAYYIHADQLDTPRQITDTNGNLVWSWDIADPFGANPPNENPSGQGAFTNNLRFPGQYYDVETGLFQNINRDYDPNTGRYVESDPIGLKGGSFSTYSYVGGNPLSYSDSSGLSPLDGVAIECLLNPACRVAAAAATAAAVAKVAQMCTATADKMATEIQGITERNLGPYGEVYSLRASAAGDYPDVRGGVVTLQAGDVYKYGETTQPDSRYPVKVLEASGLTYQTEYVGSQLMSKVVEKQLIYGYFFENGGLPPGNRIFR
jgi:RHS repeat-associated protein